MSGSVKSIHIPESILNIKRNSLAISAPLLRRGGHSASAGSVREVISGGDINTNTHSGWKPMPLNIVILGLSITSSWGNGHATTYRSLVRALASRGHDVLFLERDVEWYASNRDLPKPPYCKTALYSTVAELKRRFTNVIRQADCVIVGSYVQEGAAIGEWITRIASGVTAFYDIDTPVTLGRLQNGDLDYLSKELIPKYNLYLSFTGGPILERLQEEYSSPMARPLFCSVDPNIYFPEKSSIRWDLGYMGTYSDDRQPALESLMLEPAYQCREGRFVVAGPQFPPKIRWPWNVKRIVHLAPHRHRAFYTAQRFTLNITRSRMIEAGFSPSVRLFEAAACGTPILSDSWDGLDTIFKPGKEILVVRSGKETLEYLRDFPERERIAIGERARSRVLFEHTATHRAATLEGYVLKLLSNHAAIA
jgi:spore maturation protein CgeB